MNKYHIMSLIAAISIFNGCGSSTSSTTAEETYPSNTSSQTTADSEQKSDATSKQESENVSSTSNTFISFHHQGQSCLSCHGINSGSGVERDHSFTSGGTIFTKLDAADSQSAAYASEYSIRLVLANTNQIIPYYKGRGNANAYADFSTAAVNGYTAEVVNQQNTVVNSSAVGSHDLTRLDCNSCHTKIGTNGAPGRITSFNYYESIATAQTPAVIAPTVPATVTNTPVVQTTQVTTPGVTTPTTTPISFSNDVMPILKSTAYNCVACHGTTSATNLKIGTTAGTYTSVQNLVSTSSPLSSRLLQKATGQVNHLGGKIITVNGTDYNVIGNWITQGALNN